MDEYYLQDARQYVGNDILWWGQKGEGYTTDLSRAQVYSKEQAVAQNQSRLTDIPWPKAYVQSKSSTVVDMQNAGIDEALEGTGIKLRQPAKLPHEPAQNCCGCGRFLKNIYQLCANCGQSNAP